MVLYILNVVEDLKKPYEGNPAWALVIGWFTFGIFIAAVVYGFYSPLPAKDAKTPGITCLSACGVFEMPFLVMR